MSQSSTSVQHPVRSGSELSVFPDAFAQLFPAIIFLYDLEKKQVRCLNDRLKEYLGFSAQEFENLEFGLTGLVHAEDVGNVEDALRTFRMLQTGESMTFSARFTHRDGGCKYLKCYCSRIDESSVVLICQDVTEQVRFEEEAHASHQLFNEAEQLLSFGSWGWNPVSDRMDWTEGMFELLEYDFEPAEFTSDFLMKHVLPEHIEHLRTGMLRSVSEKKPFEVEFVLRTRTGKEKFVFTKGKPLLDKEGNVRKLVAMTRDITAKKNFQNELDRNIRELNRSNKELEEFAYVASHDMHEPLRKILTFSERLKSRFEVSLGDDGRIYLDRIWASADSMRNLIDNLLEFSKVSSGTRSFVQCDLNSVIQAVKADQELRIEETSTTINVMKLPVIEAVPPELKQLFNNLIGNALKFRRKDVQPLVDISCTVLSHKEKSDLLLPFNRVFYEIKIQDNGIGFEPAYAQKIFEIFQRLHGKTEYAGSGIGLAICKKIVDNHDGIIYATSQPGQGSVFSVILPEKQH
jgi:PAS domain S-box-containing protein